MRSEEVRALGDLAGEFAAGIATQARDVHEGIADRVFGALGEPAAPVRAAHDAISTGAYGAARLLTGPLVRGGAFAYGLARRDGAQSIADGMFGRIVVGALNGAWGDRLQERRSPLVTPMSLRRAGADVALDAESVARAFPDATGRLAVLVRGLGETEDAWSLRSARHRPYGDRLRAELGYTPLFVRYNSGLHISHNARALGALIERLTAVWPVPVAEIALFGHSMGGLVARGAYHYAGAEMRVGSDSWRDRVRHVFMLGSPHKGAPLELAANAACHALSRLPRRGRSPRRSGSARSGSRISATATWSTRIGKVTIPTRSGPTPPPWSRSQGRGEQLQFALDHYAHLGGATHFGLLNHPAVYAQLRRWLTTGREIPAALGATADVYGPPRRNRPKRP